MKKIVVVLVVISAILAVAAFGYFRKSNTKEHDNAEYVDNIKNAETTFEEIDFTGKKSFVSEKYKISFAYPEEWELKKGEAEGGIVSFSSGRDFLNIEALAGEKLEIETMVLNEVYQRGQPYGKNPHIFPGRVNGMEGMFVEPSPDQNKSFKNQSVCIMKLQKKLSVDKKSYQYLRIRSTKERLGPIVKSIKQIN